ncbi:MAG: VOC family protein [Planctomycetota bacterium]
MKLKKMTPVLVVDAIEPCLTLWVDTLGFEKTVEVPEGDALGFVILVREGLELMLQSRPSVQNDAPVVLEHLGGTALFIEVEDLAPIRAALESTPKLIEERTTFYGATEITIRTPGGHVVTFAQFGG